MKKILLFVLSLILLSSAVFAASHQVTISPQNPTSNDDLTCLVDGNIEPDYAYVWYINDKLVGNPNPSNEHATYILDSIYTKPGDIVECEVNIVTPWSIDLIGTATVTISNEEPVQHKVQIIPHDPQDSDTLRCLVDGIFTDEYAFRWTVNNYFIATGNTLTNDKTNVADIVKCTAYAVTPWATLEIGSDQVTIKADNQAPVLNLPDVEFYYGNSAAISLNDYVADDYTTDENIKWAYASAENILIAIDNNNNAVFTGKEFFYGTQHVQFTATDEQGLSTSQLISVTVNMNPNVPLCTGLFCGIKNLLPSINIFDLYPLNSNPIIRITEPKDYSLFQLEDNIGFTATFSDPDNDGVAVTWEFGDGTHSVSAFTTRTKAFVSHTYRKGGEYTITAYADDGNGGKAKDSITIYIRGHAQTNATEPIDDNDKPQYSNNGNLCGNKVEIVHIMPLNYKEVYAKGDTISLLVKTKNNDCVNKEITLRFYDINSNQLWMQDMYIDSIESQTTEFNFKPQGAGTHLLKIDVLGQEGDSQYTKYFAYTTA